MNRKQVALNCPNIEACLKKFEITTCFMQGEMKGSNRVTKVLELNNEPAGISAVTRSSADALSKEQR